MTNLKTEYLQDHIPSRIGIIEHHLSFSIPYDVDESYFHSSFLASVVTARLLINFLGIGYNEKDQKLIEYRRKNDDIGIEDVCNRNKVFESELSDVQKKACIQLIVLANKSVAHFTKPREFDGNSFHELKTNLELIKNLVIEKIPELVPNEQKRA